jgi:hypothetical protein
MAAASYPKPELMDCSESSAPEMQWISKGDRLQARWSVVPRPNRPRPSRSEGEPRISLIRSRAGAFATRSYSFLAMLGWFLAVFL